MEGSQLTDRALVHKTPMTSEERKELLARYARIKLAEGYSVESENDYHVVVVRGKRPHHLLHLILTVLTSGAWAVVWFIVTMTSRVKRESLFIDEFGDFEMASL